MKNSLQRAVLGAAIVLPTLVACSSGDDDKPSNPTSGTQTTSPDTKNPDTKDKGGSVGPSCTAYIACCEKIVAQTPAAAGACDSTRKQISDGQKNGGSVDSYESACKSGLDVFKSAGQCS